MEVVLEMLFLSFSNADVEFAKLGKLIWRSYTAAETLPTTSQVELNNKKEFAKTALDKNSKTFIVHIATLVATETDGMKVHLSQVIQLAAL